MKMGMRVGAPYSPLASVLGPASEMAPRRSVVMASARSTGEPKMSMPVELVSGSSAWLISVDVWMCGCVDAV